ncbi:MAG TPA: ParB/RepB/Spo0J family partition protein [Nitrolancea sp.]|jgi:ParB family chromosome partitioning protein|nr:ParB/RepB/Spo0J family partition protein [Nitrolancea sp.]
MAQRRGGLGRGLDVLIQSHSDATGGIQEIDIDSVAPNPLQPREMFDRDSLDGLAASIREHGVLQPIIVARGTTSVAFQIITGERRWRAAKLAGLRTIPAIIRESSPREMLELALIENVQRADLSVIEEAAAYRQLVDEFGLTQAEVAERVGKSRVTITNALRVLASPDEIKTALLTGQITEGHARALLGLEQITDQLSALLIVIDRELNVRQTEQLVRNWDSTDREREPAPVAKNPDEERVLDRFRKALGTKVELKRGRTGGRLVIHYFSDEELTGLYQRIVGEDEL